MRNLFFSVLKIHCQFFFLKVCRFVLLLVVVGVLVTEEYPGPFISIPINLDDSVITLNFLNFLTILEMTYKRVSVAISK